MAGLGAGIDMNGGEVVDNPVGSGGEEFGVSGGGAKSEDASARAFAGTGARGGVFNDNTELRMEMEGGSAFEIGLRVRLAASDVAGGNEMLDVVPKPGGAKANFGERAGGGGDDGELRRRDGEKQVFGAGKSGDVVDVLDFGAFHPGVFGEMDGGVSVREQFLNRGETGASVSGGDGELGIEIVLASPAHPNAGDGGGGVDEDAVHIKKQSPTRDLSHLYHSIRKWRD